MDDVAAEERAAIVAEHLEHRYRIQVARTARLDLDVFRMDLAGAPSWVARVFPPARPREAVEGDAAILRSLERAGFPAERCATADPVSDLDGKTVLVTTFVDGEHESDGRAFATLASLLGGLHAATATTSSGPGARPGGAWHHISGAGGLEAELEGADSLLRELEQRLPPRDRARSAGLRRQLQEIDLAGLPEGLLHPDFVPANAIRTPDGRHVLVDWTGAGRGPRVWPLGFLLYATGGRPRLVELVMSRYARHVTLTEEELDHLPEAILERALVFGAWAAAHRGRPAAQVEADLVTARGLARRVAARARAALAAEDPAPLAARPAGRARAVASRPLMPGGDLPLSALLSQAWVAWTIELDNAFEALAPHHTTREPGGGGPWLTSSVMWWNCIRHLGAASRPLTAGELWSRSRLRTNLDGMERWGYIKIDRARADRSTWVLALTPNGRRAAALWAPLPAEIDRRWAERFPETARLREALLAVVADLDPALPDCLPIVFSSNAFLTPQPAGPAPEPPRDRGPLALGALLARVLLAYTLDAEQGVRAGLSFRENLLRLLDERGVQVRELPARSGVSREAQAMALGVLERGGLGEVVAGPDGNRFKVARLTPFGVRAREAHKTRLLDLEAAWAPRTRELRRTLSTLVESGRLAEALDPPAGGWRAKLPPPRTLPHYPMVLHRGGYPDGS
ncbi:MAG: phosphotransferase [Candidatus Dormibacteraeota bacterium]|nr:phosphotransferase [Candidatus Dormibacteraeota bacterium]